MMTAYERSDIIHIMKMNRLTLSDSDTAQLEFSGQVKGKNYRYNNSRSRRSAAGFYQAGRSDSL